MGGLMSTQRTPDEAETSLDQIFPPATLHRVVHILRYVSYFGPMIQSVSQVHTIGEALPGHKQSSPGDETESESPGFVNDRVSSTVLRGPRTLTLAIPLTHEHGW